jgi:hypothetical protein
MRYYTNAGPKSGPLLWADEHDPIDVLLAPGDHTPIGTARPAVSTEGGIVIWQIVIRGVVMPGRWIVLGREFLERT